MMKKIIFLILLNFSIVGYACSCGEFDSTVEKFLYTDLIITGRVSSVQFCELETYNDDKTTNQLKVKLITFELTEVYKGGSGRFIKIITGVGGGDCGQEFIVGEDYVIFAMDQSIYNTKMDDGLYETTICRGNGLVSESEISVKILNMLKSGMKIE